MLSPDASPVSLERWQALSAEERCGLTALLEKMVAFQRNGARLGWLLIPRKRAVEVWGPLEPGAKSPEGIEAASTLSGEPLFPELLIDLKAIWAE